METKNKKWWVIFVTAEVQFADCPNENLCRWTSEFLTEEELVEVACLYIAVVFADAKGKLVQFSDEPEKVKHEALQEIAFYEPTKQVDRMEGYLGFDFVTTRGYHFELKVHCLDFNGERNFADEVVVVENVAERLIIK